MRRVYLGTTAAVAAVLLTAACGSESAESDPAAGGSASAPQYQVINEESYLGGGSVDLLIANATTEQARLAISNYAETLKAEVRDFTIRVVLTPDAKTYVCTGHWLRDADAAKRTTSVVKTDTWPYLEMNCPEEE
ncbi:MAG TPA: hypothetical protein VLH10_04020 [Yinghuangia sp.]|uniref:hypothetical protein n=1 Tax=Yinghuangia sp. YIM S10712 TaxID=3436930 RepID=UPI002B9BF9C8|nr:hypothetical protein [Yinghuangia sp.]